MLKEQIKTGFVNILCHKMKSGTSQNLVTYICDYMSENPGNNVLYISDNSKETLKEYIHEAAFRLDIEDKISDLVECLRVDDMFISDLSDVDKIVDVYDYFKFKLIVIDNKIDIDLIRLISSRFLSDERYKNLTFVIATHLTASGDVPATVKFLDRNRNVNLILQSDVEKRCAES